jgi:hypothetical protein
MMVLMFILEEGVEVGREDGDATSKLRSHVSQTPCPAHR